MKIRKFQLFGTIFSAVLVGFSLANDNSFGVLVNSLCVALNMWLGYEGENK